MSDPQPHGRSVRALLGAWALGLLLASAEAGADGSLLIVGGALRDDNAEVHRALIDALLGSMGDRDIGQLFPDTDEAYKNIRSLDLLDKVKADTDRDYFMSAEEAQAYGLIDQVLSAREPGKDA